MVSDFIANRGTLTDRSGTIAGSNSSQILTVAFLYRSYLFIQNPSSASESLFVNYTIAASTNVVNCVELLPGASIEMKYPGFVSIEQINVAAATPGHAFVAKES